MAKNICPNCGKENKDGTCVYRPHAEGTIAVYEVFDNLSQFG